MIPMTGMILSIGNEIITVCHAACAGLLTCVNMTMLNIVNNYHYVPAMQNNLKRNNK